MKPNTLGLSRLFLFVIHVAAANHAAPRLLWPDSEQPNHMVIRGPLSGRPRIRS